MLGRFLIVAVVVSLIGSCAESNLDPKVRWGAGLKGIVGTLKLSAETETTGPLTTVCGLTPDIPTNCVAECPAVDAGTGWFLSAKLVCGNQVPGTPGTPESGLWEATCGVFREGLLAGQDEGGSHVVWYTVTKTGLSSGTIDARFDSKGDIFIMPFAIDKVWVDGSYFFRKNLSGSTKASTVADMDLTCTNESKVGVDMVAVECQRFKTEFYDAASCS